MNRPRIVFIGQQNFYTDFLVDWLAQRCDLAGVIFTASDRHRPAAKWRKFRQRTKRVGWPVALSELAYFVGAKALFRHDGRDLRKLIADARQTGAVPAASVPTIHVESLRAANVAPFLAVHAPDAILTQCINEVIPASIYDALPCYVYHEGIVPQYRGKFASHWAIRNGDFENVGASLIRVEAGLDTGPVAFTQAVLPSAAGRGHGWLEHEVLFLALPRLEKWLADLATGTARETPQGSRLPLYSYPRANHLLTSRLAKENFEQWRHLPVLDYAAADASICSPAAPLQYAQNCSPQPGNAGSNAAGQKITSGVVEQG